MSRRAKLIIGLVVVVVAVGIVTAIVLPRHRERSAAHAAAEKYVGYIASGDEADLQRLQAMSASDDSGALRTAGRVLATARERIDVVDIGSAHQAEHADVPHGSGLDDLTEVAVRYRLAGKERTATIVLGKLANTSGAASKDWRVVAPLTGSINWEKLILREGSTDVYVGGVRQPRRPDVTDDGDEAQQLYPAVYQVRSRLAPYFSSPPTTLAVPAGKPVPSPELPLNPTPKAAGRIRRQVLAQVRACGSSSTDRYLKCALVGVARRHGVDVLSDPHDWWRGLTSVPIVKLNGSEVIVSGGSARITTRAGVREVDFHGTGQAAIDSRFHTPVLNDLELQE